jgi:hypothetical protein
MRKLPKRTRRVREDRSDARDEAAAHGISTPDFNRDDLVDASFRDVIVPGTRESTDLWVDL